MSKEMSRRDLLKMSGLAAAGVAGASLLGGCAPKAASSASDSGKAANGGSTAATTAAGHERAGLPSFLSAPEPIKDVKTTKDYDVVIVGAGAAGIPAAITAKEAGASVAVIQKESTAISQGNTATGILLDKSDPAGVEAVVSKLISEHDYRAKREQVELWAKNSGEAITWLFNLAQQCGAMEDLGHTKMLHDFDGGPGSMCDMPFLAVKMDGTRFCDETCGMSLMNNFLRSDADQGNYCQIFDNNYTETAASWPGKLFDQEAIKAYMPEEPGEKKGVYEGQIATFKADTLDELAKKLGITDAAAFKKAVERYNELVAKGSDEDFGKQAKWLTPIDTPPFYGIHRHVRVSAIVSGVNVDKHMQVLKDGTEEPIPGLFAIGNVAGNFFAGVDYTMWMPGLSLGRAHTQGYVIGKYVAEL